MTTGASTHRSVTSGKLAVEKAHVTHLRGKLDMEEAERREAVTQAAAAMKREEEIKAKLKAAEETRIREKEKSKKQLKEMMARMQAMEAAFAKSHQVTPHHSGGAAASENPPNQDNGCGGSAAAQG